ncbi:hypothetical protein Emag_002074 [Eimeria magna]
MSRRKHPNARGTHVFFACSLVAAAWRGCFKGQTQLNLGAPSSGAPSTSLSSFGGPPASSKRQHQRGPLGVSAHDPSAFPSLLEGPPVAGLVIFEGLSLLLRLLAFQMMASTSRSPAATARARAPPSSPVCTSPLAQAVKPRKQSLRVGAPPSYGGPSPAAAEAQQEAPKTALGYASRLSKNPYKGPVGGPEETEDVNSFAAKSSLLLEGLKQQLQQQLLLLQQQQRREGDGVVVHTGAGISTSAGIPDFRGPSGVWTLEQRGRKLADVEASIVQVFFGTHKRPVVPFHLALPTPTHLILRALTQTQPFVFSSVNAKKGRYASIDICPCKPEPQQQQQQQQQQQSQQQQQEDLKLQQQEQQQHQQQQQQQQEEEKHEVLVGSADISEVGKSLEGAPPSIPAASGGPPLKGAPELRLVDYIITQNVDALHARCGVPLTRLGEVHGSMFVERCDACARRFLREFSLPTLSFRPTGRLCGTTNFKS